MTRIVSRLGRFWHAPHTWAEFWCSLGAMAWAIWSACDDRELAGYPAYQLVHRICGDDCIEAYALLIGGLQLYSVLFLDRKARGAAAFFMCFFYSLITLSIGMSGTPSWLLVAPWIGVNVFAIVRVVGGWR